MSNMSGIQVSGTPPSVVNVTLENTDFGFVFVGRGIAKEKDIQMRNVTVTKVTTVDMLMGLTITLDKPINTLSLNILDNSTTLQKK